MGQVPKKNSPLYGIVGNGKVANHIKHYFKLTNFSFLAWDRISDKLSPEIKLKKCDFILLLINDDSIEQFSKKFFSNSSKILIHFSGSKSFNNIYGVHPLMTFTDSLYDLKTYQNIPFICEESSTSSFIELFPNLSNRHFSISKDQKGLYHALCVLAGNFTTILWEKAFKDFSEKLNLPNDILYPFMNQIISNLKFDNIKKITGPLERNDISTINDNLEALKEDPFLIVYQSMHKAFKAENIGQKS